jgi:hypothetical protein
VQAFQIRFQPFRQICAGLNSVAIFTRENQIGRPQKKFLELLTELQSVSLSPWRQRIVAIRT